MVTSADNHTASPWRDGLLLGLLTLLSVGAVAFTTRLTNAPIERNENAGLMQQISALLPPDQYDNDLLLDRVRMSAPDLLESTAPMLVLRARRAGAPVAAILLPPGIQGYGGPIQLLIGVTHDGRVLGVQVLEHRETPGIGDVFERTEWLSAFENKSLRDPPQGEWRVRRDGGAFDQFTGATITPRAIVTMVRRSLEFHESRRRVLFTARAEE